MPSFDKMSKKKHKELSSKGGKSHAKKVKKQKKEQEQFLDDDLKPFTEVLNKKITNKDLSDIVDGLIASGKKGNVKAVNTILAYLDKQDEKPTGLETFIDEED